MNKKNFIYGLLIAGTMLIASQRNLAADKERPNVIFIYADDMGKGLLSAYGQKQFSTPHIDSLINNGVSFSKAYGGSNSESARASLLTGYNDCRSNKWRITNGGSYLMGDTAYIKEREEYIDGNDISLPKDDLYLPQVFKNAGYITAQIGELEWGATATCQQMTLHGWDYYYGYLDHVRSQGFYPPFLFENGKIVMIDGNTHKDCGKSMDGESDAAYKERHDMDGKKTYSPNIFIEKTLEFIRENRDRRFFLMHCSQLPHGPVSVPEIDPEVAKNNSLTPIEKEYASMMKVLDNTVGLIMNELRELNLEKKTIIVFTSDNGHYIYYSQEKRCDKPFRDMKTSEPFDDVHNKFYSEKAGDIFNGNAGMAGLKYSNLEGGIRVPLVFYWKNHFKHHECNEIVSNYDFLPTIADLLGVKLQTKKDGISILPQIEKNKKLAKNRYVVANSVFGPALIMNDGWKLREVSTLKTYELYNLNNDPEEKYDIIRRFPEKAEELKKILKEACDVDSDNKTNANN